MAEDNSQLRNILTAADTFPCKAVSRAKIEFDLR